MNPYWEILLPLEHADDFAALMSEFGFGGFTSAMMGDHCWIFCYPSEEVKLIAKLKFNIKELPYYGTDVQFTDHPSS